MAERTNQNATGTLYLVATPIGNLADITLRALEVLRSVQLILAEDTRRCRGLLTHYDIRTPVRAYHEHNERSLAPAIVGRLQCGDNIALVSDAGMPSVSDPGFPLVRAVADSGLRVAPLPGASAVLAALVISALPTDRFVFIGYLPRKRQQRRRQLEALVSEPGTIVLLETPQRLRASLRDAVELQGAARPAALAREMTKIHEEVIRGSLDELAGRFEHSTVRGEITLCIGGNPEPLPTDSGARERRGLGVIEHFEALLQQGLSRKEALREVTRERAMRRGDVYRIVSRSAQQERSDSEEDHP